MSISTIMRVPLLFLLGCVGLAHCSFETKCQPFDPGCDPAFFLARELAVQERPDFVYTASSAGISVYRLDSGVLSHQAGSPYQAGTNFRFMTFGRGNDFVYAAPFSSTTVTALARSSDGSLSTVSGSPFATGTNVQGMIQAEPASKHLYAGASAGAIGFSLDASTGALTTVPGNPFGSGCAPPALTFTPDGGRFYATNGINNQINYYNRDASTGTLTPGAQTALNLTRRFKGAAVHPGGKFLVASSSDVSAVSNVIVYQIASADGALSAVDAKLFASGASRAASQLAMTPDGKYVYVADITTKNIYGFGLDAGVGTLTPLASGPFGMGNTAWDMQVAGGHLLVADDDGVTSGRLYIYKINSDGSLSAIAGSPLTTSGYITSVRATTTRSFLGL